MRRLLAAILALACLWGLVAAVVYLWQANPSLLQLPQKIHRELRAEGAPFVPLSAIAPSLPEALVAVEDRTFYTNLGVSFEGIARSLLVDLVSGKFIEGGSTLTQELVRDQLLSPSKTISRKVREMLLSLLITREMSKQQILTLYLNQVYFGNGAYGVAAAARTYFGTSPRNLTWAQSALLAGLPQAPSYLDPYIHLAAAKNRQRVVLNALVAIHQLSARQAAHIARSPLGLR